MTCRRRMNARLAGEDLHASIGVWCSLCRTQHCMMRTEHLVLPVPGGPMVDGGMVLYTCVVSDTGAWALRERMMVHVHKQQGVRPCTSI